MSAFRLSMLGALVAGIPFQLAHAAAVSDQSEATGFIEGSSANLLLRNYYYNSDRKSGARDRRDWTQGFTLNYSSGFTQGTVGFGVEAFGNWGIRLDGGAGTSGTGNLPVRDDGSPESEYGRAGGALKLRVSKTELRWGDLQPQAPVFAAGGSRLFPQTATGFNLLSSEIDGLDLDGGHFTGGNGPVTTNGDHGIWASYANVEASSIDYVGGKYAVNDSLSLSLYASKLEDVWRQYYGNANYTLPLADQQSLNFDFNIYRTNDDGSAKAGEISNTPGRSPPPTTSSPRTRSPWPTRRSTATRRSTTSPSASMGLAIPPTRSSSPTRSSTRTSTARKRNPGRRATTST